MAETDLPFGVTLDTSLIGTTTNADGTEATGTLFGTDFNSAADEDPDLWKSANLGDLGFLKPFFEASKKGLELHKQNAAFIKEIYEINKALMLATIDPIFAAIQAILDEILKLLKDLRGLGFYMLPVHAQSVSPNVERNPMTGSLFYGGKTWVQAKRVGGELYPADITKGDKVALDPISGEINYVEQTIFKDLDDPEQDVGGAIDKYFVQMNKWTGIRVDSGDPTQGAKNAINWWKSRGEDPKEKLLIFSDGLDVPKITELNNKFKDQTKVAFGWGTLMTNDFRGLVQDKALDPFSLVCKAIAANGKETVKLSDNPNKAMGSKTELTRYKDVFGDGVQTKINLIV